MIHIKRWTNDVAMVFAAEELQRLLSKADYESKIVEKDTHINSNESVIHLMCSSDYNEHVSPDQPVSIALDGHALIKSGNVTWLIGNEPRAVLYGVYEYAKKIHGYRWVDLKEEFVIDTKASLNSWTHEPMFARRGNVLETINEPSYIVSLIDWGTKNGLNEFFFTFFLWEEVKDSITDELIKRDLHVTLGGHSLSYLLGKVSTNHSDDNKRLKFFAEDTVLQEKVIDRIVAICMENRVVTRISLWPEDVGIDERQATDFLSTYIAFTEKLKAEINKYRPEVKVEHIAYNAGLSWNMLERNTPVSDQVDTLYAYWGRDYTQSIDAPHHERSFKALRDWRQSTGAVGTSLTVFEYYSDLFMLTELFPPLWQRIKEDLIDYKQLHVDGINNLIVPPLTKNILNAFNGEYPWKWIHHLNNYMFARLTWGDDYSSILKDYFYDVENGEYYQTVIHDFEKITAGHTQWNVPLFPARIVDPEKKKASDVDAKSMIDWLQALIVYIDTLGLPASMDTSFEKEDIHQREKRLNIYFHYLKKTAELTLKEWKSQQITK